MKIFKNLIIGFLVMIVTCLLSPAVKAEDVCNNLNTHYKAIYCAIRSNDNAAVDEELIATLSNQFSMDEELISEILAGTICRTILEYDEDDIADLPMPIQTACLPSGKSTNEVLGAWNIFDDIQQSYDKEKMIQRSASSLEFKFKAAEQYWNGTLIDAPFDLMVDLNLIEIVLFGSRAQWMSDVFTFPSGDEGRRRGEGLDELLPETDEGEREAGPDDRSDPGLSQTEEAESQRLEPECVPVGDPEADLGDGPGSGHENLLCGNGVIDIWIGEECDDGNRKSGDGCNQYCRIEAAGSNDMCVDPDAITFKSPAGSGTAGSATGTVTGTERTDSSNFTSVCPTGTVPRQSFGITGQAAAPAAEIAQNPEYPGPFLGGTMKQFLPSQRPPCGPGQEYLGMSDGEPICFPMELCADPDIARTFLAALPPFSIPGGNWEALPEDDPRKNMIDSIQVMFCVNIVENNRPQSPYQMIEGCVDCHITAMVDALEKALQTNVTPLKNTTNAFGISSAWGPNFSFNLNTLTKTNLKYKQTGTNANALKKSDANFTEALRKNQPQQSSVKISASPLAKMSEEVGKIEDSREAMLEDIQAFGISSDAAPDQEMNARIGPLLTQMRDSFANIQSMYEIMISSTALNEKEQCK